MMVMEQREGEVSFLGSCFLVHSSGYILTTSRTVQGASDLTVVPPDSRHLWPPLTRDEVGPIPVELVSRDEEHDVALLKMQPKLEIQMPREILGNAEQPPRGSALMSLGVPFGFYRVHGVMAVSAMLSGRVSTSDGARFLVFDRRVQYGDTGGPLIDLSSGKIIGIVGGIYDPTAFGGVEAPKGITLLPNLSYARSIEYGVNLLNEALTG